MSLASIEALLRERIGLNPESVGPHLVKDAAKRRMSARGLTDLAQYAARLQTDCCEMDEFVEEVVVLESWFFRDIAPYQCLREFVDTWRRVAYATQRLRVLSVPCSRGEEPFSIVMTLLDLGLDPSRFEIVGVDLSDRALRFAAAGRFGPAAFREKDEMSVQLKARFFRPVDGEQWELRGEVRDTVKFLRGNLVDESFLDREQPFDVIFCRNLIIYLAAEARQVAMQNLLRILSATGLVYSGHTESRLAIECGLRVWNETYSAGLVRGQQAENDTPNEPIDCTTAWTARTEDVLRNNLPPVAGRVAGVESSSPQPVDRHQPRELGVRRLDPSHPDRSIMEFATMLADARHAANAGRLDECAQLCERLLNETRPIAEVYCLLGVVREAQRDLAAAENCFQRALYMDPQHRESLIHMTLLSQLRGDAQTTANYRRRADRAAEEKL